MCSKGYVRFLLPACLGLLTTLATAGCASDSKKTPDPGPPERDGGADVPPAASVTVDKGTLDFSTVVQGSTSAAPMVVTVTAKDGTATVSPQILSGPFSIASTTCTGALVAPASCTISVNFSPSALGVTSAVLTVADKVTVTLTGTGIAPAGFDLTGADLGTVKVGDVVSGSVSVTATTAIAGLSCSVNGAELTADPNKVCPATLAVGASCSVGFTFKATSAGAKSDKVVCSATGSTRTGTVTAVAVTPAALDIPAKSVSVSSPAGTPGSPVTFAVVNSGGSASGALTLTPSGDTTQFTIDNRCLVPLAANASCTIVVVFSPAAGTTGAKNLTLTLTDAASPTTPLVATVAGTAVPPGSLTLTGDGAFGTIIVGGATAAKSFTLTNPGQTATGVVTIGVSDPQFKIASDGCSNQPLAVSQSCTVSLVFSPSAAGPASASLTASATGSPTATLPLTGTGQGGASLSLAPSSVDFGSVVVNTTSEIKTFTVTNIGQSETGALEVAKNDNTSSVGGGSQFHVTGTCNASLKPNETCTVSVTFSPLKAGAASASVVVRTVDRAVSTQDGTILGSGRATASLSLAPSSVDFGGVVVNTTSEAKTFTVTNVGQAETGALEVVKNDSASSVGGGSQFHVTGTCNASLKPSETCTVSVTFSPLRVGAASASVVVRTVDRAVSTQDGTILGTGQTTASLSITSCTASFGDGTVVGNTSADTCVLTNASDTSSGAITLRVDGDYTIPAVTNNCATANLAKNATCSFVVSFAPTAKGARMTTLVATSVNGGSANKAFSSAALGIVEIVEYKLAGGAGQVPSADGYAFNQTTISTTSSDTLVLAVYVRASVGNLSTQAALGSPAQFVLADGSTVVPANYVNAAGAALAAQGNPPGVVDCSTWTTADPTAATNYNAAMPVCYMLVKFKPTAHTASTGTITVSGAAGPTTSATFTGTGAGPLTIAPSPVVFSNVAVGLSSSAVTITVKNNGANAIKGLSFALDGADKTQFTVSADALTGLDLTAGATATISVQFVPTAIAAATATITVTGALLDSPIVAEGTAVSTETATVSLQGSGATAADLRATISSDGAFADTLTGEVAGPLTITVSTPAGSAATGPLSFTPDSADFTLTPQGAGAAQGTCFQGDKTLAGGETCTAFVWFTPSAASLVTGRTGKIVVKDTGTQASASVNVKGNALAPLVLTASGVGAAVVDLGTATVNASPTPSATFTLTNNLSTDIAANGLTIAVGPSDTLGPNLASLFVIDAGDTNTCNALVAKNGGTCTFKVSSVPTDATKLGVYYGQLSVTSVANAAHKVISDLKTTVVTPADLRFTAATNVDRDMGVIALGQSSAPVKYTLVNRGGRNTSAIGVNLYAHGNPGEVVAPTKATRFTVNATACTDLGDTGLAPGQTCDILVTAHPTIDAPSDAWLAMTVDLSVKATSGTGWVPGGTGDLRKHVTANGSGSQTSLYLVDDTTGLAPADLGVVAGTNGTTVTRLIALHNPTNADIHLEAGGLGHEWLNSVSTGTGANDAFTLGGGASTCGPWANVPAHGKCTLLVTWAFTGAVAAGVRTETITLTTAAATTASMTLFGSVGTAANLVASRTGAGQAGGLDFGHVLVGTQSQSETVTITNLGEVASANLTLTPTPDTGLIHTSGCEGTTLEPNASCVLTVFVVPQDTDPAGSTGTVAIASDATSVTVNLGWFGTVPAP